MKFEVHFLAGFQQVIKVGTGFTWFHQCFLFVSDPGRGSEDT